MINTRKYWRKLSPSTKKGLCEDIGYTYQHLEGVFNGRIKAGLDLVDELLLRTTLTKHDFRPDLFDEGE